MSGFRDNLDQILSLLESKDHLIDRLDLTDDQKQKLRAFFKKHPNFENKIDWNNKNLTWKDFQEVLELEGKTKSAQKKYGLSGQAQITDIVEGKDYEIAFQNETCTVYYPYNFKASEVLAKPSTPPVGITGKWCIAGKNYSPGTQDRHWNEYTAKASGDFFFIFTTENKYALYRPKDAENYNLMRLFNSRDVEIGFKDLPRDLNRVLLRKLFLYPKVLLDRYMQSKLERLDEFGVEYSEDKRTLISGQYIEYIKTKATNYTIPEGVEIIMDYALHGRNDLESLTLPSTIQNWGYATFDHTDLKTVIFPENFNCYKIPRETFKNNKYLTEIKTGNQTGTLPEAITDIGAGAFRNCMSLPDLKFPRSIEKIRDGAFMYCLGFTEVDLSENHLILLEPLAFAFCKNLKIVHLPISIFQGINGGIHPNTFMQCESLQEVYFHGPLLKNQTIETMESVLRMVVKQWINIPKVSTDGTADGVKVHFIVK